ncbi:MAG: N-6 DNA methylase [Chitinophagaceae bacterium]|nr:N-6 DNA methylase [Chitinophagaceae bacterium]MCW5904866.1 N-6 DNA methylase [Chitinophagaceae bacterium]
MTAKDEAYKKISALVKRFDEQKEFYRRQDYNETLTRIDFINPFFKALGWDTDNEQGFAESYREVIHEDKLKIAGQTKAPDYSFKYGDRRLFFVEAKKPSVSVKDDISPAYQLRRYGWTAKLPISIITDFEEFAIYDCTKKPNLTDKASNGRIKYFTYTDYLNEFDFLWETFSKERVLKGSFDKFALSNKNKKGTTTVDSEFLLSLDEWRKQLALNIALRNHIEEDELNFVVQHIIDRIIFLRIAEDRSIEPYATLQDAIKSGDYYQNLLKLFYTADQKYNSGLFDFKKDKTSSNIVIDNKVIKNIISELYYPVCPYEFSVLSVEILGSAYEQFLGKTISLSKNGKAVIEEKPEVRKAGGVYYTPQYIVDYIVKNTVGNLIDGSTGSPLTPQEISNIKICDPACGSGSFLIGAYQFLLNYHKDYYSKNGKPSKGNKDNPLTPEGNLTTAEKKRILLNNIYGVDLDANAVEVTKLSLLLKCMEGETEASIATQLKLFHERVLPTLDNNIKSGNSLIDLDYYDNELDFGEERKVKPFSWQKAFPEVFNRNVEATEKETLNHLAKKVKYHAKKVIEYTTELEERISQAVSEPTMQYGVKGSAVKGGFDCIIGNPPYGAELSKEVQSYCLKKYNIGNTDTAALFMIQSKKLLHKNGLNGFIIPKSFTYASNWAKTRDILLNDINTIVDCSKVWKDVKLEMSIYISENGKQTKTFLSCIRKDTEIIEIGDIDKKLCRDFDFILNGVNSKEITIAKKLLNSNRKLNDFLINKRGGMFQKQLREKGYYKVLGGKQVQRFYINQNINFVNKTDIKEFPNSLIIPNSLLVQNIVAHIQNPIPRIQITATIANKEVAENYVILDTVNQLINISEISDKCLLGILNSKITSWYTYRFVFANAIRTMHFDSTTTSKIPFPKIDLSNKSDKQKHNEIVKHVEQLLQLNKDLQTETLPNRIEQLKNRIEYAESKINQIIYELYDLTQSEIKLIENG